MTIGTIELMDGVTTNTTGAWKKRAYGENTFQASVTGTGAVGVAVAIEVSNDGVNALDTEAGTITLSGTNSASDGFYMPANWKYVRAVTSGITGTNAAVTVTAGH